MTRDWNEWHRAYDDPASSLSQRLLVVTRMIRETLDIASPGEIKVLSLCAGDGRDMTLAAAGHPRARDLTGLLVELDPQLASAAASNIGAVCDALAVSNADAGAVAGFRRALPVDLLLLCGIFGNVATDDIQNTIAAVPAMCRPGAAVIWTRHRREPDVTPAIREWFDAVGCVSMEFVSPGTGSFAIGCERVIDPPVGGRVADRLFTFRDDMW